jgi:hypothetical protein
LVKNLIQIVLKETAKPIKRKISY